MRFVSLDTAASEPHNPFSKLMSERPTPKAELNVVRTANGNLVTKRGA